MGRLGFSTPLVCAAGIWCVVCLPVLAAVPTPVQSSNQLRIEEALDQPTECEFMRTPLDQAVAYFQDLCGVPIVLDDRGLEDAMVDPSTATVTLSIRGITLESALNLILRQVDLTWTITDEVILITTREREEHMLVTRVYALHDLMAPPSGREARLDKLIQDFFGNTNLDQPIRPPGFVYPVIVAGKPMMVVAQTPRQHREIVAMLRALRGIAGQALLPDKRQVAQARIERALARKTECECPGTSLTEAVRVLADLHRIPILLDRKALEDAGLDPQRTRIVLSIRGITLESALNLMLRQVDVTWTITDEVVLITTPEREEQMLVTRVYPIDDLVGSGAESDERVEALMRAIRAPLERNVWSQQGKPGCIWLVRVRDKPVLVVTQPVRIQREIARLMQSLRRAAEEQDDEDSCP